MPDDAFKLPGQPGQAEPRDLLVLGRAVFGMLRMAGSEPDPRLTATTPRRLR